MLVQSEPSGPRELQLPNVLSEPLALKLEQRRPPVQQILELVLSEPSAQKEPQSPNLEPGPLGPLNLKPQRPQEQ